MSQRLESEKQSLARKLTAAILIGFAGVLVFGIILLQGWLPFAVSDVQQLIGNTINPGPTTDVLHFFLGFFTVVLPWIAFTTVRRRRHVERVPIFSAPRWSRPQVQAVTLIGAVVGVSFVLIAGKEFFFDTLVEGATVQSGFIDLSLYAVGSLAGFVAMFFAEP
ncbi:MAG TPA: hypothetical protein VFF67_10255 [Thermoplasmata archaeon]|nr:hypothetical protein [Thermoplasmata archaeon]